MFCRGWQGLQHLPKPICVCDGLSDLPLVVLLVLSTIQRLSYKQCLVAWHAA